MFEMSKSGNVVNYEEILIVLTFLSASVNFAQNSKKIETFKCEIEDIKAWAHLGLYFTKKIRAAVALNQNNKNDAFILPRLRNTGGIW